MSNPKGAAIKAFFDDVTNTVSYVVTDPSSRKAAIIDPVLDYDHRSGKITTQGADRILDFIAQEKLEIIWILETHAHADHLSAAQYLKSKTGATIGIGEHIGQVQKIFAPIFNEKAPAGGGEEFDHLFKDGETFPLGNLHFEVIATPGHTPACVTYKIDDAAFVGDTLFMPDYGTARADFPGGDARTLYRSIHKLLSLPPQTRLFMCHDYKAPGRDTYAWETTVSEQRAHNVQIHEGIGEEEFVSARQTRDATLPAPTLLLPSIQVNIHAGHLPKPADNKRRYLKIPLTVEQKADASF